MQVFFMHCMSDNGIWYNIWNVNDAGHAVMM